MRVTNTVACVLAAGAGLLLASAGLAQSPGYPDRPVKIIVPFAAAGPTDVVARLITQKLFEKFGQQFYIENVAGAGGNLGMATAGRSPPDGYTILFVSSSYTVNPSLYAKAPYDPDRDFAPVTKDQSEQLAFRSAEWAARNRDAFLSGYVGGRRLSPEETVLVAAYEADKAIYEVGYEARNRPAWIEIPLAALANLDEQQAEETT